MFVFFPGAAGVAVPHQYVQALHEEQDSALYGQHGRELSVRCRKKMRSEFLVCSNGGKDLPNEENRRLVADYRKKYPGLRTTFYGSQATTAVTIDQQRVIAVKGDLSHRRMR